MDFNKKVTLGNNLVGNDESCFIIAEAGVNHDGNIEKAKRLIDVAVQAKANAVKFQTFKTYKLVTKSLQKCTYQKLGDGKQGSYADMIKGLELDEEAHKKLFTYAKDKGIMMLSTPFDEESADFLCKLGVPALKIDSGNLNNLKLVEHIASKNKPVILSTGMASIGEIDESVRTVEKSGNKNLILLHCTSNYPPAASDINLRAMETIGLQFGVPIGYSDHTRGVAVSVAAVALGAVVIEKHFTLDRQAKGPDHLASLEPVELAELVRSIRTVENALGTTKKEPVPAEKEVADTLRRSIVSAVYIPKGTKIDKDMLAIKRPGDGIPPKFFDLIVERVAQKDIKEDSVIRWDQI